MKTAIALIASLLTALLLFFIATLVEQVLFKPHELGAILGTAFVYGRLILIIWIARIVYRRIKGKQVVATNDPASAEQRSEAQKNNAEE